MTLKWLTMMTTELTVPPECWCGQPHPDSPTTTLLHLLVTLSGAVWVAEKLINFINDSPTSP